MPASASGSFRFINSYSSTGLKPSKDTRRDVRSYVARVSHTAGTKGHATRLKGDKHRSTIVFDVEISAFHDNEEDDSPPIQGPPKKKSLPTGKGPSPAHGKGSNHQTDQLNNWGLPNTQPPPYTPYQVSPIHMLSTHTATPVANLPVYHKPFVPAILHNYITKLALPIPEIDDNSPQPLLRTVWLPMVMQNPAIFQVIVLFAAAHYATYAEPAHWHTFYAEILSLKQTALKGLLSDLQLANSPRQDQRRTNKKLSHADEDCLIAAMAKMASYESIFGDVPAYHTHMSAVARMLRGRGGLASLGMDGLLARMLRFVDTNSAFLLGTHLYLEDEGVGVCLPRHMPFRLKRFDEMEAAGAKPGQIAEPRMEEMKRMEVEGLGVVNVERFVGLCGTGDATKF